MIESVSGVRVAERLKRRTCRRYTLRTHTRGPYTHFVGARVSVTLGPRPPPSVALDHQTRRRRPVCVCVCVRRVGVGVWVWVWVGMDVWVWMYGCV